MTIEDLKPISMDKYFMFVQIYKDTGVEEVMKELKISRNRYNIFYDIAVKQAADRSENKQVKSKIKLPFSNNEDDYGDLRVIRKIKDKYRKFENTPISKLPLDELQIASKRYKKFLKTQEV